MLAASVELSTKFVVPLTTEEEVILTDVAVMALVGLSEVCTLEALALDVVGGTCEEEDMTTAEVVAAVVVVVETEKTECVVATGVVVVSVEVVVI